MPLFSERVSMLEVQNSALKKTARERAERIDELERQLQRRGELPPDTDEYIRSLQRELEQARQGTRRLEGELQQMTRELERVKLEHEFRTARRGATSARVAGCSAAPQGFFGLQMQQRAVACAD